MLHDNKFELKGFIVWCICALFFLYEFFLRTMIGTFQSPIMYALQLTSFQFSVISTTIFMLVHAIMQIPAGFFVDNFGLKKSLLVGASFCTASVFGFAFANTYTSAMLYRLTMGLGASFGFVCLLVSIYDWMPRTNTAVFIGISQFIGTLGPMLAAGPLDSISQTSQVSWRMIFIALGFLGIAIIFLIALFVENSQQTSGKYLILYKPQRTMSEILRVFMRSQPWLIAVFSGCIYCAIEYLPENEGRTFIALKGFSFNTASYMLTVAWLGYAIGCPIAGFISDFIKRRKLVMIYFALLSVISIVTIIFSADKNILFIAFFALGFSAGGQTIGFAIIAEQFSIKFVAIALALNNTLIGAIISLNAPIIGKIIDGFDKIDGQNIPSDYYIAFTVLAATSAVSLITSMFFIQETFCKSKVEFTYIKNL